MTVKDLDRLVTRTYITPLTKKALKSVRTAVLAGSVGDPEMGSAYWAVAFDTDNGTPVRMRFTFKKNA